MVFLKKFCFFGSVRLGSVITGFVTLIQACVFLGFAISIFDNLPLVTETLNRWIEVLHLEGELYKDTAKSPKVLLTIAVIFLSILIFSSILLLYGCFQIKTLYLYPFTVVYLFYIFALFLSFLLMIFLVKIEGNGLGILIVYSNLAGFVILCYLYTWSCVVSLIQIILELQQRLKHKLHVVENMKLSNQLKIKKNKSYPYAQFH